MILFSRSENCLAVTGELGKWKNITTPQMQHKPPIIRNSYFQLAMPPEIWPIPYPMRPPRATPKPFAAHQSPSLIGCSRLVYHMLVINTKAGSAHDSAAPAIALRVPKLAKDDAVACSMRKKPQRNILMPKYLPIGNRCIKRQVGNALM